MKKVGASCGSFVAMDKGIALRTDLLWARILVKMNGMGKPSSINLLARPETMNSRYDGRSEGVPLKKQRNGSSCRTQGGR